jgi:4-hydroxythreonine-4-phosphate dehydrogenase
MTELQKIRVGITQGDMNGIGPEVILKTLADPLLFELCTPVVFSSSKVMNNQRKNSNAEDFNFQLLNNLDQLNHKRANLFNCFDEDVNVEFGKPSPLAGKFSLKCIDVACEALMNEKIDVLVTAPIDKHSISVDLPVFTGHTSYLQQKFGAEQSLMLLVNNNLRVGLLTEHLPISQVAQHVTKEKIIAKTKLMGKSLLEDFGIRKPKIAILGLNPHAGDQGAIGKEELEIILPAVNELKAANILAFGPFPADGFFGSESWKNYDGILAMYHDQGLAPFKALSFSGGVNFTAGLKFVRTSPDHGTAYDIAGKNLANESSLREAIYMAIDIFRMRNNYSEISANPLKIVPRQRDMRER